MLIDWFTVVAQIVNFLVLVALLKYFLWGRLVRAIDERESRIERRLSETEAKNKEADRRMEQARQTVLEQDRQAEAILEQAKRIAAEKRDELVRQAREEVRDLENRWHEDLDRERQTFLDGLRRRATGEILAIIRRALADLASMDLEECAIRMFLAKLRAFDPETLAGLHGADLVVASAWQITADTQSELVQVLEERLGAGSRIRFERATSMAWGIELRGNGRRIGWTSDSYVESLEQSLKEILERRTEVVAG